MAARASRTLEGKITMYWICWGEKQINTIVPPPGERVVALKVRCGTQRKKKKKKGDMHSSDCDWKRSTCLIVLIASEIYPDPAVFSRVCSEIQTWSFNACWAQIIKLRRKLILSTYAALLALSVCVVEGFLDASVEGKSVGKEKKSSKKRKKIEGKDDFDELTEGGRGWVENQEREKK